MSFINHYAAMQSHARYLVLPSQGRVLISIDLHGNYEDFKKLQQIWNRQPDENTHWVVLGDSVHGPSERA